MWVILNQELGDSPPNRQDSSWAGCLVRTTTQYCHPIGPYRYYKFWKPQEAKGSTEGRLFGKQVENLYWLDQIQSTDRLGVGQEAYYLALLAQQDQPVMPGFVISAQVFRDFLHAIDWPEPWLTDLSDSSLHLDADSPLQLQAIAQQIRQEVSQAPMPKAWSEVLTAVNQLLKSEIYQDSAWSQPPTVILRPSLAGLPFQGPQGEFLGSYVCVAQPTALAQGLKQLWSELFRARNLFTWQRLGVQPRHITLAVIVQPLASAIASGTLIAQSEQIAIEAIWGLDLALHQGLVIPDRYQVAASTGVIQHQEIGQKTLAYNPRNSRSDADLTASLPEFQMDFSNPGLPEGQVQAYLLDEDHQGQPTLTPDMVKALAKLGQRAMAVLGYPLRLGWVLGQRAGPSFNYSFTDASPLYLESSSPVGTAEAPAPIINQPLGFREAPLLTGLAAASGQVTATVWVAPVEAAPIPTGVILVIPTLALEYLSDVKQTLGIITELGGMTCHTAIIARELGIPAVVGVPQATQVLQSGEQVTLDGDRGYIFRPPLVSLPARSQANQPAVSPKAHPLTTALLVSVSQPEALRQVAALPVDGIGLLRSELLLPNFLEHQLPQVWLDQGRGEVLVDRLTTAVTQFAQAFAPRPVYYRSLDLRPHEYLHQTNPHRETNPILGRHGTWSYPLDPDFFDLQLRVIARVHQAGYENLHLLLPFVRTLEEFRYCRQRAIQMGLTQTVNFQLWIMAEVPSVVWLLPDYVQAGVQGIAIGLNDLTQLILAADRDQPDLDSTLTANQPAVQRAIAQILATARELNLPCTVCGEALAQSPDLIATLVKGGVSGISVGPEAVISTYQAILQAEERFIRRL